MQITQVAASCSNAEAAATSAAFIPTPTPDADELTTPTPTLVSTVAAPAPAPPVSEDLATGVNFMELAAMCRGDTGGSMATTGIGTSGEAQFADAIVPGEGDEVSKAGVGIAVTAEAVTPEVAAAAAAAAARRSNVAVATNTTRQRASSKLLKRFPLHWRNSSSALSCIYCHVEEEKKNGITKCDSVVVDWLAGHGTEQYHSTKTMPVAY